jgi:hypothetical protein
MVSQRLLAWLFPSRISLVPWREDSFNMPPRSLTKAIAAIATVLLKFPIMISNLISAAKQ